MPTTQHTPSPLPSSDEPGVAGPHYPSEHPPRPVPEGAVPFVADAALRMIWRSPTHRGVLALDHCLNKQCGEAHPAGQPFYVRADLADEFLADMGGRSPFRTTSGTATGAARIPGLRRLDEPGQPGINPTEAATSGEDI